MSFCCSGSIGLNNEGELDLEEETGACVIDLSMAVLGPLVDAYWLVALGLLSISSGAFDLYPLEGAVHEVAVCAWFGHAD